MNKNNWLQRIYERTIRKETRIKYTSYQCNFWYKIRNRKSITKKDEKPINRAKEDIQLFIIPLERDEEESEEGNEIKILTSKKLLIRLSILLTQIKTGSNSYKLKKRNQT